MPKYIVIHPMKRRALEGILKLAPEKNVVFKTLKSNCSEDADWIRSWIVPEQEKLYCEWNAKDPESIHEVFEKSGGVVIEAIHEMHVVEGKDFSKEMEIEAY
ncbi:MAG: DUF4242 domain-containing protein [Promethearchaeota archaeon]|nr:MAG: DUF4242 domain-containing protein [Candidatus Lokiarchaeota archaeon]